jgi:fused signal recognition particle receptor
MAGFFKSILQHFTQPDIDWEDLEVRLILADLGPQMAAEIITALKGMGKQLHGADIVEVTKKHLLEVLPQQVDKIGLKAQKKPTVITMIGVNGTGKTTSTAKLAKVLQNEGQKVMVAAADTFRAAAVEQLKVWAERLEIDFYHGSANADPASVCFDAYIQAEKKEINYLICDTAGRLHTKHNLMEELKKVHRILGKKDAAAPHEILLVVDATSGANALQQAKDFKQAVPITGLIVTKLDGSGKGGIVVRIQKKLGIPTRYIAHGEKVEEFKVFDAKEYVDELL